MTQKAKKESSFKDLDLSKPVKQSSIYVPEGDCLGKEYSAYSKECTICADCDLCVTLFADVVKAKVHKIELEHKNKGAEFLDLAEMLRNVAGDKEKIYKLIVKKEASEEPVTVDELIDLFGTRYRISDREAVINWIKEFIVEHTDLCIRERKFRLKSSVE